MTWKVKSDVHRNMKSDYKHFVFQKGHSYSPFVCAIAYTKNKRCVYWFIQLFLQSFHFCCVEVQLDLLNNTNENLNQAPNIKSTSMQVSDPTDSIEEILTKFMFHSIRKFGNFSFLKLSSFLLHSWPSAIFIRQTYISQTIHVWYVFMFLTILT